MKAKKLAAFLAASIAVTSLSVSAFAASAPAETEDVSANSQFMLKVQSTKDTTTNYDGAYAGGNSVKTLTLNGSKIAAGTDETSDTLTFSYAVGPVDDTYEVNDELTVSVEGLTIKAVKSGTEETLVDNADKTWTQTKKDGYWDGDQGLTLSTTTFDDIADFKTNGSIVATWTSLTVTVPKAAEETSSDSGEEDPPAEGPTTLFEGSKAQGTSWGWNPAEVAASSLTGIAAGDTITITFTCDGDDEYQQLKIMDSRPDSADGANDGHVALTSPEGVSAEYGTVVVTGRTTFSFVLNAADVAALKEYGMTVTGYDVTITKIALTAGSGEGPGGEDPGDETTTAAPDPGAPAEPNIRPVAPAASEAPAATEAPEVVTAANGESVEAAKDVVPAGAALEVKEQPKEEAVKAVEAVKATDANKEVVETIKKAVEDDKAAVVDIDLVKDGQKVQPNGSIKVTINIPEALKDAAKLFVYRVEADGTFTDVQATVEGGKIVFTTSHFSTYIITSEALSGDAVVTEAAATTAPETTPEKPEDKNQATGVVLAVIPAMIAAAGVVISKKRK